MSNRTTVVRVPERGHYDRETINAILDAAFVCHVAFVADGQPYGIPTGFARSGDRIFVHGSSASRMIRTLQNGVDVCVTVTLVDGLVLARSVFHHSINYRSVVVLGRARAVDDDAEKLAALRLFTDHVVAGRWEEVRQPTSQELKSTAVLSIALDESSAKIRTGPPIDDEADVTLPVWAGVIPLKMIAEDPVTAVGVPDDVVRVDHKRLRWYRQ